MIIRQCQIHHRTDRNFPIYYHRTLHDIVHTQNGGLRFIENRSAHHRTKYSSVGNGNVPPVISSRLKVPALAFSASSLILSSISWKSSDSTLCTGGTTSPLGVEIAIDIST